ncbi:hypothetical protein TCAL_10154 [Tigriopus californicus]|uniref:Cytochrome P450 n=1 Tax=Tigriopus californicus TaxID=6832 RepID=A0A553N6L6_TIGCA|nr:cytochrome P450 4c3-like [Tigriopus californicus]TRY61081.1 hypothetical protein TCAL_10154 [Tigriopus californicus]|eukprot:TCALIF_10154-PA protein Name:"Similar to Cyp4c3 Cytochrome P450 4c3 (Drosophila melanogaster)" AED:0.02 eAED:0.02 QI:78/1/1/1/1/1/2/49/531
MSSIVVGKITQLLDQVHPSLGTPLFVVVVIGLCSWLYTRIVRGPYNMSMLEKIPGPKSLPILGNAIDFAVPHYKFLKVLTDLVHQNGPVMKIFLAHRPYVVLSKAKGFETILSSNKHITKGPDYKFIHPWLGLGLLTSDGGKWHSRRKMLTPAFHFKILEDFLVIMNEQSSILTNKLAKLKPDNNTLDMFPNITYCALDIICESAMGRNVNAQSDSDSPYVRSLFKASDIIFQRQTSPWMWNNLAFYLRPSGWDFRKALKILHGFTEQVIKDRQKLYKEEKAQKESAKTTDHEEDLAIGQKKRLAFLDLLIDVSDDGRVLSDKDIREEVDTFMFEGHDTTAANMSFTLYALASHPEYQAKVQTELDSIFGDDPDRPASMDDLAKMKYLEACIKESLRLYPSVPLMSRTIHEDTVIEGQLVPAKTNVILFNYLLHRDPEQFPKPEVYNPDRFLNENIRQRHAYSYVPFSAGPRNCIGQKFAMMEEKVVISSILRKFKLATNLAKKDLCLLPELILRPKDGLPIAVTPRKPIV